LVPIPKNRIPRKKAVAMKYENEKGEKARKIGWMVKYYISWL
jgi:hypothetical protein